MVMRRQDRSKTGPRREPSAFWFMNCPVPRSRFTQRLVFWFLTWLRSLTAPLHPAPWWTLGHANASV